MNDQESNPNAPPFHYNIAIEGLGFQTLIPWGDGIPWQTKYADQLLRMERISLIAKDGVPLPTVTAKITEGKKWILFSRVFGRTSQLTRLRLYAIGWEENVEGKTVKSIMWIYPNGSVECAKEPSFAQAFMDLAGKIERGEIILSEP